MSGEVEALAEVLVLAFAMDTDYRESLPEQSHVVLAVERLLAAERVRAVREALAPVRALADEHERTVHPAPYTTERALIERLRAALPDENCVWREGRMIDLSVTENLCVHNVGLTPGLWCGACNTHPEHPDRAALPPPARGGEDNPMIGGRTPLPPAALPDEETP